MWLVGAGGAGGGSDGRGVLSAFRVLGILRSHRLELVARLKVERKLRELSCVSIRTRCDPQ